MDEALKELENQPWPKFIKELQSVREIIAEQERQRIRSEVEKLNENYKYNSDVWSSGYHKAVSDVLQLLNKTTRCQNCHNIYCRGHIEYAAECQKHDHGYYQARSDL